MYILFSVSHHHANEGVGGRGKKSRTKNSGSAKVPKVLFISLQPVRLLIYSIPPLFLFIPCYNVTECPICALTVFAGHEVSVEPTQIFLENSTHSGASTVCSDPSWAVKSHSTGVCCSDTPGFLVAENGMCTGGSEMAELLDFQ